MVRKNSKALPLIRFVPLLVTHVQVAALGETEVGAGVERLDLELGDAFLRKVLPRLALLLPVVAHPVHVEAVGIEGDAGADVDVVVVDAADRVLAGGGTQGGEIKPFPALHRQDLHLLLGDDGGEVRLAGLDEGGRRRDGDRLLDSRQFQRDVEGHLLGDLESQTLVGDGLEPIQARHHRVGADGKGGHLVQAVASGGHRPLQPGFSVRDRDGHSGKRVPARVGDPPVDPRFLGGRGDGRPGEQRREQRRQGLRPDTATDTHIPLLFEVNAPLTRRYGQMQSRNRSTGGTGSVHERSGEPAVRRTAVPARTDARRPTDGLRRVIPQVSSPGAPFGKAPPNPKDH